MSLGRGGSCKPAVGCKLADWAHTSLVIKAH